MIAAPIDEDSEADVPHPSKRVADKSKLAELERVASNTAPPVLLREIDVKFTEVSIVKLVEGVIDSKQGVSRHIF